MNSTNQKQKNSAAVEALKKLLLSATTSSQADIQKSLLRQGIAVNQSKVSRLLRKVGAVKTTNEHGQIIYVLPTDITPPSTKSPLSNLIMDIAANETLIVIRTMPGSASLIARLLDHHQKELTILGTVAGDDTLFIVPQSIKKISETVSLIKDLLQDIN